MKTRLCTTACGILLLALTGGTALAQDHTKFDDHDRQVTQDWYTQHKAQPPVGLRDRDRLTPENESKLQTGSVLDPGLLKQTHPAPPDLARQLPAPAAGHRYVAVGGHVAIVDHDNRVQDVIHLHDH